MKRLRSGAAAVAAAVACSLVWGSSAGANGAEKPSAASVLHAARFDAAGHLLRPSDLDRWVFLGASLGMNYNDAAFSVEHPGAFQVVLMEPTAYSYFREHGRYADGSMFLLSFYDTERGASIDRAGFTPGALAAFEIHLIDRSRLPDGRVFYPFSKEARQAAGLPAGNACTQCHVANGAYDGTFAQFYPAIRSQALVQALNAELLRTSSATLTMEQWCRDHDLADPAVIVARRIAGPDRAADAAQRQRLQVDAAELIRYRRVELRCGEHLLSIADNWYIPSRLTSEMNRLLETTETPFGKVILPLGPHRQTVSSTTYWSPRQPTVPAALFEHRAVVYTEGNLPISEVREVYQRGLLEFPPPRLQ